MVLSLENIDMMVNDVITFKEKNDINGHISVLDKYKMACECCCECPLGQKRCYRFLAKCFPGIFSYNIDEHKDQWKKQNRQVEEMYKFVNLQVSTNLCLM